MKLGKFQILILVSLMLFTNYLYAIATNNTELSSKDMDESIGNGASTKKNYSKQTLTDIDGDGYFPFTLSSSTINGKFLLKNNGQSKVDVTVYSSSTGIAIWNAHVDSGQSANSISNLSLDAGKYYFIVVSEDKRALNVTCSALS